METNQFHLKLALLFVQLSFLIITVTTGSNDSGKFLIIQRGCRIPLFEVHGNDVDKYNSGHPRNMLCRTRVVNESPEGTVPNVYAKPPPLFIELESRYLLFDNTALSPHYGAKNVTCMYKSFRRVEGPKDEIRYSNCWKPLHLDRMNEIKNDEFVKVICKDADNTTRVIYEDYFTFLPEINNTTENQTKKAREGKPMNANRRWLSPLVIGLSGISRLQFHRQFKLSAAFLNELEAIEMKGYHTVGGSKFSNLAPLLSGLSAEALDQKCLRETDQLADSCPFLWKKYRKDGYRTVFAEDAPNYATFNTAARGFTYQPTDYYLRPMFLEFERELGYDDIGRGSRCLGTRSSVAFLLNYVFKVARQFAGKKYFGFYWTSSSTHNLFKLPDEVDDTLAKHLVWMKNTRALENTLLIITSDHGLTTETHAEFANTRQGVHENRMPLLTFVLPAWFKQKYPEAVINLRHNAVSLTTPYDLHRTLHDLTNLTVLSVPNLQNQRKKIVPTSHPHGRNLFMRVPPHRTCYSAHIPLEYCACDEYMFISSESKSPHKSAHSTKKTFENENRMC